MSRRKNVFDVIRRRAYHPGIIDFSMCPSLVEEFKKNEKTDKTYQEYFDFPIRSIIDIYDVIDMDEYKKFYNGNYTNETNIDKFGILHEKGSKEAKHMTYMHNPLKGSISTKDIIDFPMPKRNKEKEDLAVKMIDSYKKNDYFTVFNMACTIWERAWYTRSMEDLMMDMYDGDEKADLLFDKITEYMLEKACYYTKCGVDALFFGDDIGGQETILMSLSMYREYIKPRLKRIIDATRAINKDIIIFYHSCGFVTPFIEDLIEVGVDVLNPVQPECMDFEKIYEKYGDRISFHGTIGTQTTMPFGTKFEVSEAIKKHIIIAGKKGGLICAPTHLLEPEVPYENIKEYIRVLKEFKL